MKYYKKIQTLYKRRDDNPNILTTEFRDPTVQLLKDIKWVGTAKCDGTNTCVYWDGHNIEIGGHTEKSQFNPKVLAYLESVFKTDEMEEKIEELFGEKEACIYGETYGNLINPTIKYNREIDFVVFDVFFPESNHFLDVANMQDIASKLGLKSVPVIMLGTLDEMRKWVMSERHLSVYNAEDGTAFEEGIVARPTHELFDSNGNRIIVKIKWKDIKGYCKDCKYWSNKDSACERLCEKFNMLTLQKESCSKFEKR